MGILNLGWAELEFIGNFLRGSLIIQYFLLLQLPRPYFIRPAHGQNQFLEEPLKEYNRF